MTSTRLDRGFTLVELAVVMLVFTLLAAGAVTALRVQTQRANFRDTQAALSDGREALLGFAAANGRLPCPADPAAAVAAATEGVERATCNTAALARGLIPWKTLGIVALDAWDQRLTYQVAPDLTTPPIATTTSFNTSAPNPASLNTPNIITSAIATPVRAVTLGTVAFALWSHGPNGHHAVNVAGVQQPANTDTVSPFDEASNNPVVVGNTALIVARAASEKGSPMNEFDDMTIWTSKFTLFKRLIDAGYNIPIAP